MDSYQKKNRGHNNHHSNYHSNYRDHSANRESFDGSYGGSSRSDSTLIIIGQPNDQEKCQTKTEFHINPKIIRGVIDINLPPI
ncbi:hypothetical protein GHT06_015336 [Daphnia sinensis]|uniref:Uncharacterized protein n=1 Tax=Daphnia sinensis TaxID=1820382 RepID=A0AAD5LA84_9CRUS|nr:hypothetical protein GHT06_015336 [Daphnia sinensis]